MRNDFAALIPPFVVAAAFIVAVAAFLRREMAPRRRRAGRDRRPDMPRPRAAGTSGQHQQAPPDQPADEAGQMDGAGHRGADSGAARRADTGRGSSDAVAQEE